MQPTLKKNLISPSLYLFRFLSGLIEESLSPASPVQAKCEQSSPHSNIAFVQRSIVLSAPTVLTIQLLRFENIHGISSKVSTHVKCDERIYLRSGDGNSSVYQHRSTVAHTGLNANSGHYIAYKTFQDRYFRMSDGKYRELTQP